MSTEPSWLQWLRSELKRRKVLSTMAAYAVGAFGLLQVVDLIGPALGWPDRVLTYSVVGAVAMGPIVIALAWMFDVRREAPVGVSAAAATSSPAGTRRSLALMALSLLASGLLVWLMWPGKLSAVADFLAGDRILISECDNTSGESDLEGVLNVSLTTSIRQSTHVEVVSHSQVRSFAESYLGRERDVPVDPDLADQFAIRTGLKVVVHCAVTGAGTTHVVTASIFDPRKETDLAVFSEEADGVEGLCRVALAEGETEVALEACEDLAGPETGTG